MSLKLVRIIFNEMSNQRWLHVKYCGDAVSDYSLLMLHSEYRSTYRWHEYTGGPEVVRKPPVPNQFVINAPINEPPLPRRKKCPELAYRHHEFIADAGADKTDSNVTRARSNDRNGTPSRRSKSEGPPIANGRCVIIADNVVDEKPNKEKAGESSGLFRKTISKLSTEYRLQFVWPNVRRVTGSSNNDNQIVLEPPRKSQSMGAIKSQSNTLAGIHKKRTTNEKEATVHELEPLVNDVVDSAPNHEKKDLQNEYRKNFNTAHYSEKEKFGFEQNSTVDNKVVANGSAYDPLWYKEVIELRKKAGEYKNRGWSGETHRELSKKQAELWDQVSRRSSLSALSLASSIRPISKEEKERENKNKSSPTKPSGRRIPGSARLIDNRTVTDGNLYGRLKRETIRHHLERTTGPDAEEGALLPSPTREKLMPTLPRSKTGSPQRGSPQKTISSRHGSPHKASPQKSPKKISKVGRSQSVGPTVTDSGSPKKQAKPMSASITAATASSAAKTHNKKTPVSTPTSAPVDRQTRPMEDGFDGPPQILHPEQFEQIVKSPPEPTRVKSPEQIIMRSPDPVFWTVPLDTGKTFTVTQNVREGDVANIVRPHSEIKVSTPSEAPARLLPQVHPQSAPPELSEQEKLNSVHASPVKINEQQKKQESLNVTAPKPDEISSSSSTYSKPSQELPRYDRPVPGSTLRCLEDPDYPDINSPPSSNPPRSVNNPVTEEIVDKARDRFDRFWGNPGDEKK